MIDSPLRNDENILLLARKVKDIPEVLRVTWQNLIDNKAKEKYGANGINMIAAVYGNDSTEEAQTFIGLNIFVAQAVHSQPEKHYIPVDGFKELIADYRQKKN